MSSRKVLSLEHIFYKSSSLTLSEPHQDAPRLSFGQNLVTLQSFLSCCAETDTDTQNGAYHYNNSAHSVGYKSAWVGYDINHSQHTPYESGSSWKWLAVSFRFRPWIDHNRYSKRRWHRFDASCAVIDQRRPRYKTSVAINISRVTYLFYRRL